MDAIGVRIVFKTAQWPENLKASSAGKADDVGRRLDRDDADAENFLDLAYGPEQGPGQQVALSLPAYDRAYRAQKVLPTAPNARALIDETKMPRRRVHAVSRARAPHLHRPRAALGRRLRPQPLHRHGQPSTSFSTSTRGCARPARAAAFSQLRARRGGSPQRRSPRRWAASGLRARHRAAANAARRASRSPRPAFDPLRVSADELVAGLHAPHLRIAADLPLARRRGSCDDGRRAAGLGRLPSLRLHDRAGDPSSPTTRCSGAGGANSAADRLLVQALLRPAAAQRQPVPVRGRRMLGIAGAAARGDYDEVAAGLRHRGRGPARARPLPARDPARRAVAQAAAALRLCGRPAPSRARRSRPTVPT